VNTSIIHFNDENDPYANTGRLAKNKGEASFGLHYYTPSFYAGLSALNLLQTKLDLKDIAGTSAEAQYFRHYYLNVGGRIGQDEKNLSFYPNALLKMTQNTPLQYEVGMRMTFNRHDFGLGVAYRGDFAKNSPGFVSFNFNTLLDKRIPIVLGFDVSTGAFGGYSGFSYELMSGYNFNRKDMSNYITLPSEGK
jgi:type IX secretion system PorP/SprF family membrane protein